MRFSCPNTELEWVVGISESTRLLLQREAWELLGSLIKQRLEKEHIIFFTGLCALRLCVLWGLEWQFASRAESFLRWAPWRSISKMCFTPTSIPTASRSRWSSPVVGLTGWSSRFPFSTWTGSPKVWFVKPLLPLWTRWFLSYALLLPYSFRSHYLICAKNMGKRWTCYIITFWFLSKGLEEEEFESDDLKPLLVSLKYMKAQYTHHNSEAAFIYEALRPEPSSLIIWT